MFFNLIQVKRFGLKYHDSSNMHFRFLHYIIYLFLNHHNKKQKRFLSLNIALSFEFAVKYILFFQTI